MATLFNNLGSRLGEKNAEDFEVILATMIDPHADHNSVNEAKALMNKKFPDVWIEARAKYEQLEQMRKKLPHADFVSAQVQ